MNFERGFMSADSPFVQISTVLGIDFERQIVICKTAAGAEEASLSAQCILYCRNTVAKQENATFIMPKGYARWSFEKKHRETGQFSRAFAEWANVDPASGEIRMTAVAYPPVGLATITVYQVTAVPREVADAISTKWWQLARP
jgi:hypothetical protein